MHHMPATHPSPSEIDYDVVTASMTHMCDDREQATADAVNSIRKAVEARALSRLLQPLKLQREILRIGRFGQTEFSNLDESTTPSCSNSYHEVIISGSE